MTINIQRTYILYYFFQGSYRNIRKKGEVAINIYQLQLAITFSFDVQYEETNEILSNFISSAMLLDEELKTLHKLNTPKFYIFSLPTPIEREDKAYKKGRVYIFDIRSFRQDMILKFKLLLPRASRDIRILTSEIRTIKPRYINKLISLTPVVSVLTDKCWVKEDGMELLMGRIHSNAVKKAKILIGDSFGEPADSFIECINLLNIKPIKLKYKTSSILGNKLEIIPRSDDTSQALAWIIVGAGLLEKGSQGYGYCIAK